MSGKRYKLKFLPLFEDDLNEIVDYITDRLKNRTAAINLATTPRQLASNPISTSNIANAVPGNIAALNLPLDFNNRFTRFLTSMDQAVPGIGADDTLLYAPAVEWWMEKAAVDRNMETTVPGLYAIGDGAGLSRVSCMPELPASWQPAASSGKRKMSR